MKYRKDLEYKGNSWKNYKNYKNIRKKRNKTVHVRAHKRRIPRRSRRSRY